MNHNHSIVVNLMAGGLCLISLAVVPMRSPAAAISIHEVEHIRTGDSAAGTEGSQDIGKEGFIQVDGPTLEGRLRSAISQARNSSNKPFWVAYCFPIRPGSWVDGDCIGGQAVDGATGRRWETRNAGVFLLYSAGGQTIQSARIYDLDRRHDFGGQPVFWLGRADSEESIALLRGLLDIRQSEEVAKNCVAALGLHEATEAGDAVKAFTTAKYSEPIRSTAVFWVGRFPGMVPFLDRFAREQSNGMELRKQAVFSIGSGDDEAALPALKSLFGSATSSELRKQIVFAFSINKSSDEGVSFLIKVAHDEGDREVRKSAIFWLGQKAGQRTLKALGELVDASDEDTEVQKQAVFAISQRPKDEAIPILIRVAKTHKNPEVRKQAMFWLGQTEDDRAVAFFEEVLKN